MLDVSVWSLDKEAKQAVETCGFTTIKIGEDSTIIRQGDAECFLGLPWCGANRLCLVRGKSSQEHTTEISWQGYMRLSWWSIAGSCPRRSFCSTTMPQLILHRTQSNMLLLRAIKFCLPPSILLTWHPVTSSSFLRWRNHCIAGISEWRGDFRGGEVPEQPKCRVLQPRSLPSHPSLGKICCFGGWICREGLTPSPSFMVAAWFWWGDI